MCPAKPIDPKWRRVHELILAYIEANKKGPVPVAQRNEAFAALHDAMGDLARTIVKKKAGRRPVTPISEEVVARVWNASTFTELMKDFDPKRGNAFSLFFKVLSNHYVSWARHAKTQGDPITLAPEDWDILLQRAAEELVKMPVGHPIGSLPERPDELLERKQTTESLNRALQKLTPRQQLVLRFRKADHLTIKECAQRLGVSESTVELDLKKAVEVVKAYYPDPP